MPTSTILSSRRFRRLAHAWHRPSGYRDALRIGLPLVFSMSSTTLILFTDRVFLGQYSVEALAASTPAGMAAFMFASLFLGIVTYANTFIAQFVGGRREQEVGAALWHGVYLALIGGVVMALLAFIGPLLFSLFGHDPEIQRLEVQYFGIMMLGTVFMLMKDALACFYSGRGYTGPILWVNLLGATVNIPLDYVLIHGFGPIPAYGVVGAAVASVAGQALMMLLFLVLVFRPRWRRLYGMHRWRLDPALLRGYLRYGGPAGIQFFMDVFTFTFFIAAVGRLGRADLAASNIAFALNTLAFLPMVGVSVAANTLVGQAVGGNRPEEVNRAVTSAMHIAMSWMWIIAAIYLIFPHPLIRLFQPAEVDPALFAEILDRGTWLLRFIAFYCLFDAMNLVYVGALKGLGDTAFIGWVSFFGGLFGLVIPVFVAIEILQVGVYVAWGMITVYVCCLAMAFRTRFRRRALRANPLAPPHGKASGPAGHDAA